MVDGHVDLVYLAQAPSSISISFLYQISLSSGTKISGSGIRSLNLTSVVLHVSFVVSSADLGCFLVPPFRVNPLI